MLCRPAMSAARGSNVVSVSGSPAFISTLAGGGSEIEPRQSFYSTMITCNGGVAYSPDCSRIYVGFSHASNPQIRFLDLESQMVDVLCGLPAPPQAMACNRLGYISSWLLPTRSIESTSTVAKCHSLQAVGLEATTLLASLQAFRRYVHSWWMATTTCSWSTPIAFAR